MEKKESPSLWDRLISILDLNPKQTAWVKVVAVGLAVGFLLLNASDLFGLTEPMTPPKGSTEVMAPAVVPGDELAQLERSKGQDLEEILANVRGAGSVKVKVSLKSGPAVTPIIDTQTQSTHTEEKDSAGSSRDTTTTQKGQTHVITKGAAGELAIAKRDQAEIAGVLIVATGARSQTVKAELFKAARVALGVSPELIDVQPAEGR